MRRRGTLSRGIVHHFTSHHVPSAQRFSLFVLSRHERPKSSDILKGTTQITCFIRPNSIAGKARGLGKTKTAPVSQTQLQHRRRFSLFPGNQIGTLATIVVILPIAYWSIFPSALASSSNALLALKVVSLAVGQNKVIYLPYLPLTGISFSLSLSLNQLHLAGGRVLVGVPTDYGMEYKDVWLNTQDGVDLHCWFIPAKQPKSEEAKQQRVPTFLLFHGNAGSMLSHPPPLSIH